MRVTSAVGAGGATHAPVSPEDDAGCSNESNANGGRGSEALKVNDGMHSKPHRDDDSTHRECAGRCDEEYGSIYRAHVSQERPKKPEEHSHTQRPSRRPFAIHDVCPLGRSAELEHAEHELSVMYPPRPTMPSPQSVHVTRKPPETDAMPRSRKQYALTYRRPICELGAYAELMSLGLP
jgi:hypothetical protein